MEEVFDEVLEVLDVFLLKDLLLLHCIFIDVYHFIHSLNYHYKLPLQSEREERKELHS